ncbi:MAG: hypothetical protein DGJ47_000421, partial [Rickettsiaceae bacterium]
MQHITKFFKHSKTQSFLLAFISALFFTLLITYHSNDPSFNLSSDQEPLNLLSYPGSYLADLLFQGFGLSAFIIPICFFFWSLSLFYNGELANKYFRIIMMVCTILALSVIWQIYEVKTEQVNYGGLTGMGLVYLINNNPYHDLYNEYTPTILIFCTLLFLHGTFLISLKIYLNCIKQTFSLIIETLSKLELRNRLGSFDNAKAFHESGEFDHFHNSKEPENSQIEQNSFQNKPKAQKKKNYSNSQLPSAKPGELPDLNLLEIDENKAVKPQSKEELSKKSQELLEVLADFGVKGNVIAVKEGPVVTMYEFEPAAGTKSSRVIALADDIARSLSAISTRIAVIPGRNALGIELPNKQRMFFRLRELVETTEFQNPKILLPIILGKDLAGNPMVADLAKMPHLLVAGTTGSGKSVAINTMIMSLLYRYTPEECRMIMIDPKMLELSAYDNIPHLMTPVVTEPGKAIVALKWAVKEMENRYRLMSHLGVRNIANYNSKIQEAIKNGEILHREIQTDFDSETGKPIFERVPLEMNKMPFIVVVVDEMADLMLVAGKDIETSIQRLAQMARAAGIHIIMATQRPSVDIITGVIKANFPSRISFKVTSKIDSRTILGEQGSEQLLGMGDMLYMGNSSRILRVHGPFVSDSEVEKVTSFLKTTGTPEYVSAIVESTDDEDNNSS